MTVKILAVDDSVTMRKIMEMTFAGEDVEVAVASNGQEGLARAQQMQPDVVFADASMQGMDGYALAHAIKSDANLAQTAVIVLASQHNPFDEAKGKTSGVDDHVAKPFDSQVVIDKVAQVLSRPRAKASGTVSAAAAAPPAAGSPVQAPPRSPKSTVAFGAGMPKPAPPKPPVLELADDDEPEIEISEPEPPPPPKPVPPRPAVAKPVPPRPAVAKPARPAPVAAPPKPAPAKPEPPKPAPVAKPEPAKPAPVATPAAKPASPAVAAATSSGGDMAAKLGDLGLSKEQVEGVLALSREVIEQVVWEVVPDLAETLIKEEIRRLTSD